ncbi:hypothetical protein AgCh_038591 [Apium graveolens]
MKVITKVLANRMKLFLNGVVSENQSAFIPGRLISDNIMVFYEIMHYLKKKRVGKDGFMALKLDMSKAYDRIEREFLREILLKMGFSNWWVHLGLSSLIRKYEEKRWIHGIKICRKAPVVSHMLFADDSYVYCKANAAEGLKVMELLNIYESALGQKEITKDIERSLAKFWWDDPKTGKKIHWLRWERLCNHKSARCMGFRNFRDFNVAMLRKQAWRMITILDALVTKMHSARYFDNGSFFYAKLGHNPSFIWRSIWESRDLIMVGIRWRVYSGEGINIKGQPWLNDHLNPYLEIENQGLENQKVESLLCVNRRDWDVDLIRDMFYARDQYCILNTKLDTESDRDVVYWHKETTGVLENSFGRKSRVFESSFAEWLNNTLSMGNRDEKAEVIVVCWSIWKARKDVVWNKKPISVNRVVALAKQHLFQWKAAQIISTSALLQPSYDEDGASNWVKPKRGIIKVTVDAVIFEDREEIVVGIVARDCSGDLLQAQTKMYKGLKYAEWTEAMAVKEALSWSDMSEWKQIEIESDCLLSEVESLLDLLLERKLKVVGGSLVK